MAEIGAEPEHLSIRVEPLAVPAHDGADGERVTQIVDARSTPVLAEALCLAQSHVLGDDRKVVACAAVGRPPAVVVAEERPRSDPEKSNAFGVVGRKTADSAWRDRHEAGLAVLATLHRDHAGVEIDIVVVELQGFVDAQPGDGDEPE